ncbi:hypothetical protein C2G38_2208843 [Gigaspora rosea]|uniref:Uncharacterized protein n=1 Tax=Gigaspora rosea TaxID=44941 RepID=A0A397UJQ9_9GLOM|nr:hypothetical protein C2G38_2208843 [Gigaspora rosea]CAG8528259.1 10828_t:CDS:1 [Gigaspora rosea]
MPKTPIYKVHFETFINIFDNLDDNLDALHFAQTSKYLARFFKQYNYPTPNREVLISLTTNIKPKRFYFKRSTIGKKKREPLYIEFDPKNLPCKNCVKYFLGYKCDSKKPCNICLKSNLECKLVEKTVQKRAKKTQKKEYYCNSPFQFNEKLVCVKERDIGKRQCENCLF